MCWCNETLFTNSSRTETHWWWYEESYNTDLIRLWDCCKTDWRAVKSSIPNISHKRVLEKNRLYFDKYQTLLKPYKARKDNASCQSKIESFADDASSLLFDIASCKCLDFSTCKCDRDSRVPIAEQIFLIDQRTIKRMMIGHVDAKLSRTLVRREKRKREEILKIAKHRAAASTSPATLDVSDSDCDVSVDNETDSAYTPLPVTLKRTSEPDIDSSTDSDDKNAKQMRTRLSNFACECDRHGVNVTAMGWMWPPWGMR